MKGSIEYEEARIQLFETLKDELDGINRDDAWRFFQDALEDAEVTLDNIQCSAEDALFVWALEHLEKHARLIDLQAMLNKYRDKPKKERE